MQRICKRLCWGCSNVMLLQTFLKIPSYFSAVGLQRNISLFLYWSSRAGIGRARLFLRVFVTQPGSPIPTSPSSFAALSTLLGRHRSIPSVVAHAGGTAGHPVTSPRCLSWHGMLPPRGAAVVWGELQWSGGNLQRGGGNLRQPQAAPDRVFFSPVQAGEAAQLPAAGRH